MMKFQLIGIVASMVSIAAHLPKAQKNVKRGLRFIRLKLKKVTLMISKRFNSKGKSHGFTVAPQ